MLGFRQPSSREERRAWWLRQLSRQQSANLSVAEFCRRLGVSTVSFYTWKRRFRETSAASALRSEKPAPQSTPTTNGLPTAAAFLPVSILDVGATGQLEIELANACVVRLKGAVDPDLLRIAIRAAGRLGNGGRGTN